MITALGVSARGAFTWYPMAFTYWSSKCSSAESASWPRFGISRAISRIASLASSKSGPKNSRHTVRVWG